jgi:tRNA(fMet)-specific endonuclease VapC
VYLLDTNIISYSLDYPESNPHLMSKIRTVKQRDQHISLVTVYELIKGRLSGLSKANQRYPEILRHYHYFEEILEELRKWQMLPYDEAAEREFQKIPGNVRCGLNDKRIAATALANNFTLVTANVQDFEDIPNLRIEDWTARPLE